MDFLSDIWGMVGGAVGNMIPTGSPQPGNPAGVPAGDPINPPLPTDALLMQQYQDLSKQKYQSQDELIPAKASENFYKSADGKIYNVPPKADSPVERIKAENDRMKIEYQKRILDAQEKQAERQMENDRLAQENMTRLATYQKLGGMMSPDEYMKMMPGKREVSIQEAAALQEKPPSADDYAKAMREDAIQTAAKARQESINRNEFDVAKFKALGTIASAMNRGTSKQKDIKIPTDLKSKIPTVPIYNPDTGVTTHVNYITALQQGDLTGPQLVGAVIQDIGDSKRSSAAAERLELLKQNAAAMEMLRQADVNTYNLLMQTGGPKKKSPVIKDENKVTYTSAKALVPESPVLKNILKNAPKTAAAKKAKVNMFDEDIPDAPVSNAIGGMFKQVKDFIGNSFNETVRLASADFAANYDQIRQSLVFTPEEKLNLLQQMQHIDVENEVDKYGALAENQQSSRPQWAIDTDKFIERTAGNASAGLPWNLAKTYFAGMANEALRRRIKDQLLWQKDPRMRAVLEKRLLETSDMFDTFVASTYEKQYLRESLRNSPDGVDNIANPGAALSRLYSTVLPGGGPLAEIPFGPEIGATMGMATEMAIESAVWAVLGATPEYGAVAGKLSNVAGEISKTVGPMVEAALAKLRDKLPGFKTFEQVLKQVLKSEVSLPKRVEGAKLVPSITMEGEKPQQIQALLASVDNRGNWIDGFTDWVKLNKYKSKNFPDRSLAAGYKVIDPAAVRAGGVIKGGVTDINPISGDIGIFTRPYHQAAPGQVLEMHRFKTGNERMFFVTPTSPSQVGTAPWSSTTVPRDLLTGVAFQPARLNAPEPAVDIATPTEKPFEAVWPQSDPSKAIVKYEAPVSKGPADNVKGLLTGSKEGFIGGPPPDIDIPVSNILAMQNIKPDVVPPALQKVNFSDLKPSEVQIVNEAIIKERMKNSPIMRNLSEEAQDWIVKSGAFNNAAADMALDAYRPIGIDTSGLYRHIDSKLPAAIKSEISGALIKYHALELEQSDNVASSIVNAARAQDMHVAAGKSGRFDLPDDAILNQKLDPAVFGKKPSGIHIGEVYSYGAPDDAILEYNVRNAAAASGNKGNIIVLSEEGIENLLKAPANNEAVAPLRRAAVTLSESGTAAFYSEELKAMVFPKQEALNFIKSVSGKAAYPANEWRKNLSSLGSTFNHENFHAVTHRVTEHLRATNPVGYREVLKPAKENIKRGMQTFVESLPSETKEKALAMIQPYLDDLVNNADDVAARSGDIYAELINKGKELIPEDHRKGFVALTSLLDDGIKELSPPTKFSDRFVRNGYTDNLFNEGGAHVVEIMNDLPPEARKLVETGLDAFRSHDSNVAIAQQADDFLRAFKNDQRVLLNNQTTTKVQMTPKGKVLKKIIPGDTPEEELFNAVNNPQNTGLPLELRNGEYRDPSKGDSIFAVGRVLPVSPEIVDHIIDGIPKKWLGGDTIKHAEDIAQFNRLAAGADIFKGNMEHTANVKISKIWDSISKEQQKIATKYVIQADAGIDPKSLPKIDSKTLDVINKIQEIERNAYEMTNAQTVQYGFEPMELKDTLHFARKGNKGRYKVVRQETFSDDMGHAVVDFVDNPKDAPKVIQMNVERELYNRIVAPALKRRPLIAGQITDKKIRERVRTELKKVLTKEQYENMPLFFNRVINVNNLLPQNQRVTWATASSEINRFPQKIEGAAAGIDKKEYKLLKKIYDNPDSAFIVSRRNASLAPEDTIKKGQFTGVFQERTGALQEYDTAMSLQSNAAYIMNELSNKIRNDFLLHHGKPILESINKESNPQAYKFFKDLLQYNTGGNLYQADKPYVAAMQNLSSLFARNLVLNNPTSALRNLTQQGYAAAESGALPLAKAYSKLAAGNLKKNHSLEWQGLQKLTGSKNLGDLINFDKGFNASQGIGPKTFKASDEANRIVSLMAVNDEIASKTGFNFLEWAGKSKFTEVPLGKMDPHDVALIGGIMQKVNATQLNYGTGGKPIAMYHPVLNAVLWPLNSYTWNMTGTQGARALRALLSPLSGSFLSKTPGINEIDMIESLAEQGWIPKENLTKARIWTKSGAEDLSAFIGHIGWDVTLGGTKQITGLGFIGAAVATIAGVASILGNPSLKTWVDRNEDKKAERIQKLNENFKADPSLKNKTALELNRFLSKGLVSSLIGLDASQKFASADIPGVSVLPDMIYNVIKYGQAVEAGDFFEQQRLKKKIITPWFPAYVWGMIKGTGDIANNLMIKEHQGTITESEKATLKHLRMFMAPLAKAGVLVNNPKGIKKEKTPWEIIGSYMGLRGMEESEQSEIYREVSKKGKEQKNIGMYITDQTLRDIRFNNLDFNDKKQVDKYREKWLAENEKYYSGRKAALAAWQGIYAKALRQDKPLQMINHMWHKGFTRQNQRNEYMNKMIASGQMSKIILDNIDTRNSDDVKIIKHLIHSKKFGPSLKKQFSNEEYQKVLDKIK